MSQKYSIKNACKFSLVNKNTNEVLLQSDVYMDYHENKSDIKNNLKHLKVSATIYDGSIYETDIYVTEETYNELIEINKKLNKE